MINGTRTPEAERDCWRTPRWLFDWLDSRFSFEVDLAADGANALCAEYVSVQTDALSRAWHETWSRGFLNCPYSNIDPWVEQAILEQQYGFLTVMVFPSPNGEERFDRVFRHASEIIDIVGRVHFIRPDGTECKQNTRGTSVYIFDPARRGAAAQRWWVMRDELIRQYGGKAA